MFRVQLLIPLVAPAGFAPLPGMRGLGIHTLGELNPPPGDLLSLGTATLASLSCRTHLRVCMSVCIILKMVVEKV